MVLLSEIIEIIARSSDINFYAFSSWTKGRSLLHDLRITTGLGGCVPRITTPGSAPVTPSLLHCVQPHEPNYETLS